MEGDRYALCRFVEFPDRDIRYEIVTVESLSGAEHDDLRDRYLRVVRGNHPPMLELLAEIVEDFRLQRVLLTVGVGTGVPSLKLARRFAGGLT